MYLEPPYYGSERDASMGQITIGVLYGIEIPADMVTVNDDYDGEERIGEPGVLEAFEDAIASRIKALHAKLSLDTSRYVSMFDIARRFVPDTEYDGNVPLIGFWCAVGASGRSECASFGDQSLPLSAKAFREHERFARSHKNARRRWRRFARWAAERGIALPKPRLWITPTEVA